jgi:hypothetical protein
MRDRWRYVSGIEVGKKKREIKLVACSRACVLLARELFAFPSLALSSALPSLNMAWDPAEARTARGGKRRGCRNFEMPC